MSTNYEKSPFHQFGLDEELIHAIVDAGFTEPRPIQRDTIPFTLEGRDILGLAQTGTGKTAAFALPILQRLLNSHGQLPQVLILAPTRELAIQIDAEIRMLAKLTHVRTATIYGGVDQRQQVKALRRKPEILVACPGRLLDLMQQKIVNLSEVHTLVLDEADHMFDMGFLPDIKRVIAALPAKRQNLLFSATMPKEIRGLADKVLTEPHVVELNHSAPAATIEHALYPVRESDKVKLLQHLLAQDDFRTGIVFTRTKHRAKRIAQRLDKAGHFAVALQGNMSQSQRDRAMNGFRNGKFDILVATDIAARGIDVAKVSHVINFDVPSTPEAYTHRIGRTGRAEQQGRACTFVTSDDRSIVRAIERRIDSPIPRVNINNFTADDALPAADEGRSAPNRPSTFPEANEAGQRRRRRKPSAPRQGRPAAKSGSKANGSKPGRSAEAVGVSDGSGKPKRSRRPRRDGAATTNTESGDRPKHSGRPKSRAEQSGKSTGPRNANAKSGGGGYGSGKPGGRKRRPSNGSAKRGSAR